MATNEALAPAAGSSLPVPSPEKHAATSVPTSAAANGRGHQRRLSSILQNQKERIEASRDSLVSTADQALRAASHILTTEFAKDPAIRQQTRDFMAACGVASVTPTERGMNVIDEYHLYYVSVVREPDHY